MKLHDHKITLPDDEDLLEEKEDVTDEKERLPFFVGGVYEKVYNGVTHYGVLTAAKRTTSGALSGKIEYQGYPYELVVSDDFQNWKYVRGGVELE